MEIKPPEPKDAFQGYVIAMIQTMYEAITDNTERVRNLEGQWHKLVGIASVLGVIGGFASVLISKLISWKS